MKKQDYEKFNAALSLIAEALGKPIPDDDKVRLQFSLLQDYDIDIVMRAMQDHTLHGERGDCLPLPSDIVKQIQRRKAQDPCSQALTPEQAWAKALKLADEEDTVYVNDLIIQAYGQVSHMMGRDIIGAKITFMQTYNLLEKKATSEGRVYPMRFSYGYSKQKMAAAVESESRFNSLLHNKEQVELLPSQCVNDSAAYSWVAHQEAVLKDSKKNSGTMTSRYNSLANIAILREVIASYQLKYKGGGTEGKVA